jgi:YD repeat-containing protein
MKQIYPLFLLFLVTFCTPKRDDKDDPEPALTDCIIQEITYEGGSDKYTFDANGRLLNVQVSAADENGVIQALEPWSYEYNSAGMVKTTRSEDGYTDNYNYDASGKLTSVEFKDGSGEIFEKFDIKLDDKGRLSELTTLYGYACKYYYNGPNGEVNKVEILYEGQPFDVTEYESFESDKSKKSYSDPIKGHFFDPAATTDAMMYYPFNPNGNTYGLPGKSKWYTGLDDNWENLTGKLRIYSDFQMTREFNSNNYAITRKGTELLDNSSYTNFYSYSNCK